MYKTDTYSIWRIASERPLSSAVSPVPPERADVIRCDTTSVPVARAL